MREESVLQYEGRLDFHSPAGSLMFRNNSYTLLQVYHLPYGRINTLINNGSNAGTFLNGAERMCVSLFQKRVCCQDSVLRTGKVAAVRQSRHVWNSVFSLIARV